MLRLLETQGRQGSDAFFDVHQSLEVHRSASFNCESSTGWCAAKNAAEHYLSWVSTSHSKPYGPMGLVAGKSLLQILSIIGRSNRLQC